MARVPSGKARRSDRGIYRQSEAERAVGFAARWLHIERMIGWPRWARRNNQAEAPLCEWKWLFVGVFAGKCGLKAAKRSKEPSCPAPMEPARGSQYLERHLAPARCFSSKNHVVLQLPWQHVFPQSPGSPRKKCGKNQDERRVSGERRV